MPSGLRIWLYLLHEKEAGKERTAVSHIAHGILGDGAVRVRCYKQGAPEIYELHDDGTAEEIQYREPCAKDKDIYDYYYYYYHYDTIEYEHKGYKFRFTSGEPYVAEMTEPDGTEWRCEYDYEYGAGFED